MNAPEHRVGRRDRPVGQRGDRPVADPELEEPVGELGLDLVEVEVQDLRPNADQASVEHEVGIGPRGEHRHELGLGADRRGVDLELLEAGLADLALLRLSTCFLPLPSSRLTRRTLPAPSWSIATASGAPE